MLRNPSPIPNLSAELLGRHSRAERLACRIGFRSSNQGRLIVITLKEGDIVGNGFSDRYRWTAVAVAASLGWAATAAGATQNKSKQEAEAVGGELVVKLREDLAAKQAKGLIEGVITRKLGSVAGLSVRAFRTDARLQLVRLPANKSVFGAIAALSEDSSVAYAEPNYIYRANEAGLPDDTDFSKLWGIHNTGQTDSAGQVGTAGSDVNVLPLWAAGHTGSKDILVAVIDTGVDWDHPDLAANIYTNPGEAGALATNGKDDDGNGFVDDVHGYNFAAKNANSRDDHNHGTHVSGTIGGIGNNGRGVAGVNWSVSILPVKFLTAGGSGTLADAVESINYARIMKAKIMSNSWGGGGFSQAMKDAIQAAHDAGILFVAAAGNESNNNDTSPTYPCTYDVPNVVSVAATDNRDVIASFSNYGARKVHVAAPGVKVYSTVKAGAYATYSGTSMATPHTAGVAALVWSANPTWDFAEVKSRLIRTSDPIQALRRKVLAKGRVNAYNAFHGIVPPSDEPDESAWIPRAHTVESPHPYADHADLTYTVKATGAKFIRIIFERIQVETSYDKVFVQSPAGEVAETLTGSLSNYTSEYVKGDSAVIRLKSDESNTGFGFKVSQIQVIE